MPVKIRKKSEGADVKQPDQVMTGLQTTYGMLDKFKYHLAGAFVALVVILLGVSWFMSYRESKKGDLAKAFFDAFKFMDSPVGEDVSAAGGLPSFKTQQEKYARVSDELGRFIEEHGSADIGATARLVMAGVKMELGDYQAAYDGLSGFASENADSPLAPLVYENLGFASIRLGKIEEAVQHFTRMKELTSDPYLNARALLHLGDLYNPGQTSTDAGKDAAKARQFYEEALELLPAEGTAEEQAFDPALSFARQELELRLTMLDLG
ncbi:MAG: tetratricopeptide repeat protein [Deltaproteobacteria bacterium]|nr:tetratricopeptide repeat protein [Deltaproteobacteria bacterium]